MRRMILVLNIIIVGLISSCSNKTACPTREPVHSTPAYTPIDRSSENNLPSSRTDRFSRLYSSSSVGDCGYEDGEHTATVDYYNPSTGFSNTYTLEVEVEDCEVTTIYFPKGGYLDGDHIESAGIDEDGNATITDDRFRTFEVHIDDDQINDDSNSGEETDADKRSSIDNQDENDVQNQNANQNDDDDDQENE